DDAVARALPGIRGALGQVLQRLEREFGDVQDVEFTVENGKLWMLQTRTAKRTPRAAVRIAIDLVHEGLISTEEA
ncbi:PEP/pyruvate-binding domain-containing protein, partial [Acinetobacter baumannii]|uniref:PEP/pyruvate-binding domain-containing protein n=1 Tax=Acinetobacter baumannii TaxID=470 RepID=UPI001D18CE05